MFERACSRVSACPFPLWALSARGQLCQERPAGAAARPGCAWSLTRLPARAGWQRSGKWAR
jgi:hypothetical protein